MVEPPTEPPASLLLVHGSGSGPWIFDGWGSAFPGVTVVGVDLHAGLDVSRASHADYADAVIGAAAHLPRPLALCGWSMGGLVALQAAEQVRPDSVIVIEPSAPAEVQGFHPETEITDGSFDPEALYGRRFPAGIRARPESARARAERKRGISVPSLPCPSLVVFGDEFREERGKPVARLYGSDELDLPGLDHWDVVLDERVRRAIAQWLGVGVSEPGTARER
jgi:pimeloyl-ACP methyl ester carboxylesterase